MKHESSLMRSPSLWGAQSRHLVNDIVRKVVRIHLHTLGQNIDEKLVYSIEEHRQRYLLMIMGRALKNRGIIP
jgi:hypothetical protein